MIEKRLSSNKRGDAELVIRVTGISDIYRLAYHLTSGQCEFAAVGRRVQDGLRRRMGAHRYKQMLRFYHGDGHLPGDPRDRVDTEVPS